MLIPSIDLQGGAVVQLVQGERLAIRDDDVFKWVRRFERFPKVQVIDLDAATGAGDNLAIVRQLAAAVHPAACPKCRATWPTWYDEDAIRRVCLACGADHYRAIGSAVPGGGRQAIAGGYRRA